MSVKSKASRKKRFDFTKLREKFIEKIFDNVLGAIVTGSIGVVVIILLFFWGNIRSWISDVRNVSYADAMNSAKLTVGAKTIDVIPFRNRDRNYQYIAVIATESPPNDAFPLYEIYLLEGKNGLYEITDTKMSIFEQPPSESNFGVIDFDKDGNKEVFAIEQIFGGSGYSFNVQVYSTIDRNLWTLEMGGEYNDTPVITQTNVNKDNEKLLTWMTQAAEKLTPGYSLNNQVGGGTDWEINNGKGFYSGKPILTEIKGKVSEGSVTIACHIDDGQFEWTSFFKYSVFAYDKQRNVNYIIYTPWWDYGWVQSMISGKDYLWLGVGVDNGLLTYHKASQTLSVFPIPELKYAGGIQDAIIGILRYDDSALYFGDTKLTLPENISFPDEFANAYGCDK